MDVRSQKEWEAGHIEGSLNIPLNRLAERVGEVPSEGQVIVHCEGGYRSTIAVSLLQEMGRDNVVELIGGFKAWVKSGLPSTAPIA